MTQTVASSPYVLNEREPFTVRYVGWLMGAMVFSVALLFGFALTCAVTEQGKPFGLTYVVFANCAVLGYIVIASQGVARAFHCRQFEYWLGACPVSAENFTPEDVAKESAFVDWILACPGGDSGRIFSMGTIEKITDVSECLAIRFEGGEDFVHVPFVRRVLSAVFSTPSINKNDADSIGRQILSDLADWTVSDLDNWAYGRGIRALLEEPEFERFSAMKAWFPNFAGSIFPPKGVEEFQAVISFLSSFVGSSKSGGLTEELVARLFFGLIRTIWCTPMDPDTTVRFKRLLLVSSQHWDEEENETAFEFCLRGHFGAEIAEFSVPLLVAGLHIEIDEIDSDVDPDDLGVDSDEETDPNGRSDLYRILVRSNLSEWVDPAAVPGIKVLLADLGCPNVFEDDHPAGMPVEMRLEEDELPGPKE